VEMIDTSSKNLFLVDKKEEGSAKKGKKGKPKKEPELIAKEVAPIRVPFPLPN